MSISLRTVFLSTLVFSISGFQTVSAATDSKTGGLSLEKDYPIRTVSQTEHINYALFVRIRDDGKIFVSGGSDGKLKLWDAKTRKEVRTISTYDKHIASAAFLGKNFVVNTAGLRGKGIAVWNIYTGKKVKTYDSKAKNLASNRSYLFAASDGIEVWDFRSDTKVKTLPGNKMSLSTKASGLAVYNSKSSTVTIYDDQTLRSRTSFTAPISSGWGFETMALSHDGKNLAICQRDQGPRDSMEAPSNVILVNTSNGRISAKYHGLKGSCHSVSFSSDDKYVLAGDWNGNVVLWDKTSEQKVRAYNYEYTINEARFMENDEKIAIAIGFYSGSTGNFWQKHPIFMIDTRNGEKVETFSADYKYINDYKYVNISGSILSDDNRYLAINNRILDLDRGAIAYRSDPESVISFQDKNRILKVNNEGYKMISVPEWKTQFSASLPEQEKYERDIFFDKDKKYFYVRKYNHVRKPYETQALEEATRDAFFAKYDASTGRELKRITEQFGSLAVSKDHSVVAVFNNRSQSLQFIGLKNLKPVYRDFRPQDHQDLANRQFFEKKKKEVLGNPKLTEQQKQKQIGIWEKRLNRNIAQSRSNYTVIKHTKLHFVTDRIVKYDGYTAVFKDSSPESLKRGHLGSVKGFYDIQTGQQLSKDEAFQKFKAWRAANKKPSGNDRKYYLGQKDDFLVLGENDTKKRIFIGLTQKDSLVFRNQQGNFDMIGDHNPMYFVKGIDVYKQEQFFDHYFVPKLLTRTLRGETIDEGEMSLSQRISQFPPPKVEFVTKSHKAKSKSAEIVAKIHDTGGGIAEIRFYHNGKRVNSDTRAIKMKQASRDQMFTFNAELISGSNKFRIVAESKGKVESVPGEITIAYEGAQKSADLHVVAIGINEYKNKQLNLNYAFEDARAVTTTFQQNGNKLFKNIYVHTLYNKDATKDALLALLQKLSTSVKSEDVVLFYYAGHGTAVDKEFYFVTAENVKLYNVEKLKQHALSMRDLKQRFSSIPSLKQVLIMDACQSGAATEVVMRGAVEEKALAQLSRSTGMHIMAASGSEQFASEISRLGHGTFTYTLLQGISGNADGSPKDGKITVRELMAYLDDQVPVMSERYKGEAQYPSILSQGNDFPLILQ